jgi:hypothetical protein
MFEKVAHAHRSNMIIFASIIASMTILGFSLASTQTVGAAKRDCRVTSSTTKAAWYEGGFFTSKEYTVPSTSECLDINIRNVKNTDPTIDADDPDKYCSYFKVAMYPSDVTKPVYYSKEKRVCSQDPSSSSQTNGPVIPIATSVKNGTKYRILHKATDLKKRVSYQIVD